jgi:cholesterol transport system auxiliary component
MTDIDMRKYGQIAPYFTILVGFLMLSGCASGPPATYELFSPSRVGVLKTTETSLVVAEPKSSRALEADGAISYVPGAQWADRVPVLLQTSIIKAIEAKGYSVSREGGGVLADHLLTGEITAFNLVPGTPAKVELALTMRLIDAREGRLIASQAFYADSEIGSFAGSEVVGGFDKVLSSLMPTIAQWALARH